MWGREHMKGSMMNEKMMEMMTKEDIMELYAMKLDKKIAMLKIKLDYMEKKREMLRKKM